MRRVALTLVAALGFSIAGCAPARPATPPTPFFAAAHARGLDLEDPLAIDDEMKVAVDAAVARSGSERARIKDLLDYIKTSLAFDYRPEVTLTARETFREHRGDCMAFAHLFVATARYLGLPAYFVHVADVQNYYERGGLFFVSSHVAAGVGQGPNAVIIDVSKEIEDFRVAIYDAISDEAAAALYYDNVAVDELLSGNAREAETLLRFLATRAADVPEVANNLAVVLNRRAEYDEALAVIQGALTRFPTYEPLYTNGIRAAHLAGKLKIEHHLEDQGMQLTQQDPFLLFARGLSFYQAKRFDRSITLFERASSAKPDSVTILAWLTRAQYFGGKRTDAVATFAKASKLAPGSREVEALTTEIPALRE